MPPRSDAVVDAARAPAGPAAGPRGPVGIAAAIPERWWHSDGVAPLLSRVSTTGIQDSSSTAASAAVVALPSTRWVVLQRCTVRSPVPLRCY